MAVARRRFDDAQVYRLFNRFYESILRQKQKALVKAHNNLEPLSKESRKALVEEIMLFFESELKAQSKEMLKMGHLNHNLYLEAEYMMVALIDEVFLNLDWQARDEWEKKILEARVYNTHNAGENVFIRIEKLLEKNDPIKAELAAIYLEALSLGFKGKFKNTKSENEINKYIDRLYFFIFHKNPMLDEKNRKLIPTPYTHTLRQSSVSKMPDPKRLYQLMGGIILLLIIVSYFIWVGETYGVESRIQKIIKTLMDSGVA